MKKKTLILVTILLIAVGVSLSPTIQKAPQETTNQEVNSVSLTIAYGEGNSKTYSTNYSEGITAFGILKDVAEKEKISLETQQFDFGIFVKKIEDKESTAEIAWIYFVNGEAGSVAADTYTLKPGDTVEWKYIKTN